MKLNLDFEMEFPINTNFYYGQCEFKNLLYGGKIKERGHIILKLVYSSTVSMLTTLNSAMQTQ